jgi:thymidylate synthase (FAD)
LIKATYMDHMGSDVTVVNAARVSFGKKTNNTYTTEKDDKLIKYLAKHKHMSPFGHCFASFHVKAPIFVARQLVKHKFLRWNEISRRYVDKEPEFYVPDVWRGRSEDKKQGSSDETVETLYWMELDEELTIEGHPHYDNFDWGVTDYTQKVNERILTLYQRMIDNDVAPEQARMVLPQSMMTEWYWSGSLDAFADMCNLRCASDTQVETRLVATQISDRMRKLFPVSWGALVEVNGHQAETLTEFDWKDGDGGELFV